MTGSSHQRRIRRRLQERLSKRSEGRYPWLESALSEPEKVAEAEDAISAVPALRSGGKPPKDVISSTSKPIAPPEPRGEAEGALVICGECGFKAHLVRPGKWECRNALCPECVDELHTEGNQVDRIGKKRRTLWNWLRKLVGR